MSVNSTNTDEIVTLVAKIYFPIVTALGITGNSFNLMILSRKKLIVQSSSIYLIGLAIVDILVLIFQAFFKYVLYKAFGVEEPFWLFLYLCVYNHWALVGAIRSSYWVTVAFTIERWITISFPVQGKVWCTSKRAKVRRGEKNDREEGKKGRGMRRK